MKKRVCGLLALLMLCLCGCQFVPDLWELLPWPTTQPTATTAAPTTAAPTTAAPTTEPTEPPTTAAPTTVPTEPPTTAAPSHLPYVKRVYSHDQRIFREPSYDSRYNGTVRTAGRYTIVDERYDSEGNLWGKLKSGAGWVDLTDIDRVNLAQPMATMAQLNYTPDFAHETFCEPGEYTLPIIVHVYTDVTNLGLFPEYAAEVGFGTDQLIRYLPSLSADTPLVIHADFPGDMTTYILRFDANGRTYEYYIYQSGRTGLAEYYQTAP